MPQEFRVLRCYKCETFQVDLVKKSNKWECKICGDKQSVKQVYGSGTGKECRLHVQKLNQLRMLKEGDIGNIQDDDLHSLNNNYPLDKTDDYPSELCLNSVQSMNNDKKNDSFLSNQNINPTTSLPPSKSPVQNKWAKYLENVEKPLETENNDLFDGVPCVLELPSTKEKRTYNNNKSKSHVKKFKGKADSQHTDFECFQNVNEKVDGASETDEYWDKSTVLNECWGKIGKIENKPILNADNIPSINKSSEFVTEFNDQNSPNYSGHSSHTKLHFGNQNGLHWETDKNIVASTSKWMKYVDSPENVPIQSNEKFITNYTKIRNHGGDFNRSKYVNSSDMLSESGSIESKIDDIIFNVKNDKPNTINPLGSTTIIRNKVLDSHLVSKNPLECRKKNQADLESPMSKKSDFKSILSKFEVGKTDLKIVSNKRTANVSQDKQNAVEKESKNFTFDSFMNNDGTDLDDVFDL